MTNKGKLLKSDSVNSVFTLKIYFNKNHHKTGTQLELRYWSNDFEAERKSKSQNPAEYSGYHYLVKFINDINAKGELWCAILSWNRILDQTEKTIDGKAKNLIIHQWQVEGIEKKFTTSEEQRRYIVEDNMRKMAEEEAAMQVHGGGYSYHEFE